MEKVFILSQSVDRSNTIWYIGCLIQRDHKTCSAKPVGKIIAIPTDVSPFTKTTSALVWVADGNILVSAPVESDRDTDQGCTSGLEHAVQLSEGAAVVWNMFQYMGTNGCVERISGEGQFNNISQYADLRTVTLHVNADILNVLRALKSA